MRIAYVINSMEGGGATTPVPAIAQVLRNERAELRILALTPRDRRGLPAMAAAGLDVAIREGGERDHREAFAWLDRMVAQDRPDLIWTSLTRATLLGQLVGLKRRVPVVSWQHAAYLKPANERLLRATRRLSKLWIGDSECVTTLTATRLRVAPSRLVTWPIFAADRVALQAQPWQPGQTIRIGSLGRLHPVKGYDVLIAALARLRANGFRSPVPFELTIGGEGEARASLEAAIAEHDLTGIRLPGFADRSRHFLAGLHLYVQPSRSEGFCIAAHEAMQAGLGVVASAVGELPYSIEDGVSGGLVPPEDPDALANALARLLAYPDMLSAIGAQSRQRVLMRFGQENFAATGRDIMARVRRF